MHIPKQLWRLELPKSLLQSFCKVGYFTPFCFHHPSISKILSNSLFSLFTKMPSSK
ncbi:hypothetical protein MtrunA17_Chr2g0307431 [Medicago truncatula]|uniref:Uncharacterized protein n=1 Tax=Medicago truncatula TaxID=3880 RepID=A0A396JD04_MEDTR|nr:hypothetical protein MtrunA17_Chr2g0307431 [Medicago truncatula]